jgi:hypothetical protein
LEVAAYNAGLNQDREENRYHTEAGASGKVRGGCRGSNVGLPTDGCALEKFTAITAKRSPESKLIFHLSKLSGFSALDAMFSISNRCLIPKLHVWVACYATH